MHRLRFFDATRRQLVGSFTGLPVIGASLAAAAAGAAGAAGGPQDLDPPPGSVLRYGARGDGTADDTDSVAAALRAAAAGAGPVVFPAGHVFKITRYCEIFSDTTIHLLGTLQLTGRASGLFANGAANIGIYGFKTGRITDTSVAGSYAWNPVVTTDAPAIHLRSVTNAHVEGLVISHVSSGILVSTCTTNTATPGGAFKLGQKSPQNVTLRDNHISLTEYGALCAFQATNLTYDNNTVFRSGDGGIWMMGAIDSAVINNTRLSPRSTPADVARYGSNNPAHPTTWNDEQGMEFENCHGLLISSNSVSDFSGYGIDIKNGCVRVICASNRLSRCQSASICTREGDAVKNACIKVSIVGNTITDHGIPQYPKPVSAQGAIRTGETYICEILGNIIYGYQTTVGIGCYGPGSYQDAQFPKDAHQASVVVSGNCFDFKNSSFENDQVVGYAGGTPSAIAVQGAYDSVRLTDNKITADVYAGSDSRFNATAAITLAYVAANGRHYPSNAKLDGNTVCAWGGRGIDVRGLASIAVSGLSICNNSMGPLGAGPFIAVTDANCCNVSGNTLSQITAGPGAAAISIAGTGGNRLNGALVCNNQIAGGSSTGGNSLTFGIEFAGCRDCNASNNSIVLPGRGMVSAVNCAGDIVTSGTTGFPRSGAGSPAGTVTSYHAGEAYRDSNGARWYFAVAGNSKDWEA